MISSFFRHRLSKKKNICIGVNSVLGTECKFPHPYNITIGKNVVIKNNCTIYQNVTIGQNKDKYPYIMNNVIIYPGAVIVGDIEIGNNVVIGANAVVVDNVPDNAIAGGVPAKILGYRRKNNEFY